MVGAPLGTGPALCAGVSAVAGPREPCRGLSGHAASDQTGLSAVLHRLSRPYGDGNGENAPWIDPKPRDFTAAVFKCRSTPDGDAAHGCGSVRCDHSGVRDTNMPRWLPLTGQQRADLVATSRRSPEMARVGGRYAD